MDTFVKICSEMSHLQIQRCIENNIDINKHDEYGSFPLIAAIDNQQELKTIKLLVQSNADINGIDKRNQETALHCASYHGAEDIVHLLLENKANPNLQNNDGDTPLTLCCYQGHTKIAIYLIEHVHVDLDLIVYDGDTALILACYENHGKIVKSLLEHNAGVNAVNLCGESALVASCVRHDGSLCVDLLRANAQIDSVIPSYRHYLFCETLNCDEYDVEEILWNLMQTEVDIPTLLINDKYLKNKLIVLDRTFSCIDKWMSEFGYFISKKQKTYDIMNIICDYLCHISQWKKCYSEQNKQLKI